MKKKVLKISLLLFFAYLILGIFLIWLKSYRPYQWDKTRCSYDEVRYKSECMKENTDVLNALEYCQETFNSCTINPPTFKDTFGFLQYLYSHPDYGIPYLLFWPLNINTVG